MADLRLAWALAAVVGRHFVTVRGVARSEISRWRQRAQGIPDPRLRQEVLGAFDSDRSIEGAAAFAVLQPGPSPGLVRLLVAYVLLWSAVDAATDREGFDARLLAALPVALRPDAPTGACTPMVDDAGYISDLICVCQAGCAALPAWSVIEPLAVAAAERGQAVQEINHGDSDETGAELRRWAETAFPTSSRTWLEHAAAASGPLDIHALIALAANTRATPLDAERTADAYARCSALSVLADHLIDEGRDASAGRRNYMTYLGERGDALISLAELTAAALHGVRQLPNGDRHTVIVTAMVTMFFSHPSARQGPRAALAAEALRAAGPPARLLAPIAAANRRSR